jgi:iron complex outermembrane receptor protein
MKRIFTLVIVCALFSTLASAQANPKITGIVKDEQGKPLQSATVSLLRQKDSSLAKVAVTDATGQYEFITGKPGKYIVSVVLVGYIKTVSPAFDLATADVNLPAFSLRPSVA